MQNSSRRTFLKQISGMAMFSSAVPLTRLFSAQTDTIAGKPNFVLIFCDDMGYADPNCYGGTGYETPNLNQMAIEGMRFTDFHVAQAVCSASRAALMTGCYNVRVGIKGALFPSSEIGLNPNEETIAEVLKKQGYVSGIFGKWHLGHHHQFLPLQQGFNEYVGLPYSNDMWPVDYDGTERKTGSRKSKYPDLPLIENNTVIDYIRTPQDQDKLTTIYTERAVKFIKNNKNKPFFLYVPHSMPHVPLGVSDKFRGKSKQGKFGDVMMEIDWSVGQILKTLKDEGLDDNTLVIFTSDNGPWLNFGNHAGSAKPLREGKGSMWEGGCRVPCIMRWPKVIKASTVCDELAATIDILPTFAAIAGAPLPEKKIDGINLDALIKGQTSKSPRQEYYYYYAYDLIAVRRGPWKLVLPHQYSSSEGLEPGRDGLPGPRTTRQAPLALYNLKTDINERNDVAAQNPTIVEELQKLAEKARSELGDSLTNREVTELREPGKIKASL